MAQWGPLNLSGLKSHFLGFLEGKVGEGRSWPSGGHPRDRTTYAMSSDSKKLGKKEGKSKNMEKACGCLPMCVVSCMMQRWIPRAVK